MIEALKKFFGPQADTKKKEPSDAHDIRVATCAILLEMANIDKEFSDVEQSHVVDILKSRFGLDAGLAGELIENTDKELENSVDLWQFTNRINQNYKRDEKLEILETVWKLVLIDGIIDKHEDYLIRKLSKLLRLSHKDMIDTKLTARAALNADS